MAQFRDEWLTGTLAKLIGEEELERLKQGDNLASSLWETVVAHKAATDSEILSTLATKFRVKIADIKQMESAAKGLVTEDQARKYHILPVRATDSYLEIATANPFDLEPTNLRPHLSDRPSVPFQKIRLKSRLRNRM